MGTKLEIRLTPAEHVIEADLDHLSSADQVAKKGAVASAFNKASGATQPKAAEPTLGSDAKMEMPGEAMRNSLQQSSMDTTSRTTLSSGNETPAISAIANGPVMGGGGLREAAAYAFDKLHAKTAETTEPPLRSGLRWGLGVELSPDVGANQLLLKASNGQNIEIAHTGQMTVMAGGKPFHIAVERGDQAATLVAKIKQTLEPQGYTVTASDTGAASTSEIQLKLVATPERTRVDGLFSHMLGDEIAAAEHTWAKQNTLAAPTAATPVETDMFGFPTADTPAGRQQLLGDLQKNGLFGQRYQLPTDNFRRLETQLGVPFGRVTSTNAIENRAHDGQYFLELGFNGGDVRLFGPFGDGAKPYWGIGLTDAH